MIHVRKARERGHFDHGWLDTWHTFSFGDYYDPAHMGYRTLRVINEDTVAPGTGFPMHAHRDMEILTYVLAGAVAHRDSIGSEGTVAAGEIQRMSAGTGITHSERNPSRTEALHLLQIWILPERRGIAPGYEQKAIDIATPNRLHVVASPDARDGSLRIFQDATLLAARLDAGKSVSHAIASGRGAWIQVARGEVELKEGGASGTRLAAGDGAAVEEAKEISVAAIGGAEVLIFDLK